MKLEVLLSVMNINKKDLDKMNILSKCCVINQTNKTSFDKYKNFNIYSYKEKGLSLSRNRGLEKVTEDIIILCDDDVVYNDDYEKIIINEFKKNKKADIIIFNVTNPYRQLKENKKNKRLHFYNILRYPSYKIAFRRKSIKKIYFNTLFGAGAKYSNGEDSLFLVDALRNKLRIYSSTKYIGKIAKNTSTWFYGYNEKFFYDKGALYTAINNRFRYFLIIQYLIRHKEVYNELSILEAYSCMKKGSNDYLDYIKNK